VSLEFQRGCMMGLRVGYSFVLEHGDPEESARRLREMHDELADESGQPRLLDVPGSRQGARIARKRRRARSHGEGK
jgi:hypothetical protein